jgi:pimeloyl-ACP methyl ester carboxylesterase
MCHFAWSRLVRLALAAAVVFAAFPGCATVRVRRVGMPDLVEAWKASVGDSGELSVRSRQTLRCLDLEHVYDRKPAEAFARLHAEAVKSPQPELLFALAEISYLRGRDCERWNCGEAVGHYYLCAGYAYHFLFATAAGNEPIRRVTTGAARLTPEDAFDPRFRLACELYNAGLAKCIAAAQRVGRLDPREKLNLPMPDGSDFSLSVVHVGFPWKPEDFGPLQLCSDFEVSGLNNLYRGYGLGVPLIATRNGSRDGPARTLYPKGVSFPVTAFFRFEGTLADLGAKRCGRLELYNPLTFQAIEVQGRQVPLETDLTTPFAYFLANTDLDGIEFKAFLDPDGVKERTGIYLVEPYQPGKIPVVLVHGLLSSPLTWAPLFNDLRADPVLREKYQFLFYFYPSSDPYLETAADLRQALWKLREGLDPRHQDKAFDEMVLVGHSMGGLVSRLLTVPGGDDFWALASPRPLKELKVADDTRQELRQVFYFEEMPFVKRVVFLGTPHRGSRLSPSPLGWLAVKLAGTPKRLMSALNDVAKGNPEVLPQLTKGEPLATSVDLLDPDSPALKLLAVRPKPAGVHYHSVIGITHDKVAVLERLLAGASPCEDGDGVVPASSARLDTAESEVVVPADHNHLHQHPVAVMEVRRILLQHAGVK